MILQKTDSRGWPACSTRDLGVSPAVLKEDLEGPSEAHHYSQATVVFQEGPERVNQLSNTDISSEQPCGISNY